MDRKKLLLICCGILFANILVAQTIFTIDGLVYERVDVATVKVAKNDSSNVFGSVVIPPTIADNGNSYSVVSIGDSAFLHCSNLTSITIPNSVTSIGKDAFYYCDGLTSITLPNSVTSIGKTAFSHCSGLTFVSIPNSVTSIGKNAFFHCSGLTSITIPSSVTSIATYAFRSCTGLAHVRCLATNPPSLGSNVFNNTPSTCSLTVPCGSSDTYSNSAWNAVFSGRISEEFSFELNASANDIRFGTVVINDGNRCNEKVLTATPSSCYHFTGWNDGNTENPRTITVTQDTTFLANFEKNIYTKEIQATICSNKKYDFNGRLLSTEGTYIDTLQTINGCDSVVTLTLEVTPVVEDTMILPTCARMTFSHSWEMSRLPAVNGCDSITYGKVITNPIMDTTITATICENTSYTENGFNEIATGIYIQNLKTVHGCDSTVTLNLTVNPVKDTIINASICEGSTYMDNGFNESTAGTHTLNLQTIHGCDSIVTLNLTVNPIIDTTISATICENTSYTDNGFNVSETGIYIDTIQTANGCRRITLNLTVNPVKDSTINATICTCSTYTENGFNVSEAGTHTLNLQTVNGCDSIVTLTLTVNPVESTNLTAAICEGTSYTENGFNVSEAGTHTLNLQTVNGCDSIVTLNLTVNPVKDTNLSATICERTLYMENGFEVGTAGTHILNLQTYLGCDSIVTLNLAVNPVYDETINAAICEGESYAENGFNENTTGTYTQNLHTYLGCDSTVTLNLTVNPVMNTTINAVICEGTSYTDNGFNVSTEGTYSQTLQTVNGCDSTVVLELKVAPNYNDTITATIKYGEFYDANGFFESERGEYVQHLNSQFGCDSVIILNLRVDDNLNVYIPNAFTPQSSPNEMFCIFSDEEDLMIDELVIYNRYGGVVFQSRGSKDCWDGKYNGSFVPQGTYSYHLIYHNRIAPKKKHRITGTVMVLK